jgi:hypothetical protein
MPNLRRSSLTRQIGAIRKSLLSIEKALRSLSPLLTAAPAAGRKGSSRRARTLTLSPARRAALKIQGQYMGHLRVLKARQKARVKTLRAAKGVRAAIRLAQRLTKA